MSSLLDIFKSFAGVGGQLAAANVLNTAQQNQAQQTIEGGEIAAQGLQLSADAFRQSKISVQQATDFNLQVGELNTFRQLQSQSSQYHRFLGRQLTQQAGTGFSLGSKSFLMQRTEAVDIFSRQVRNVKLDAENARRSAIFTSQVQQTNLENQARAAEYQASATLVQAGNAAAQSSSQGAFGFSSSIGKVISEGLPTILSQLTAKTAKKKAVTKKES